LGTAVIAGASVGGALGFLLLLAGVVYLIFARKAALEEKQGRKKLRVNYP